MSCCRRLCAEFKHPMFGVDEPPKGRLDLQTSFHIGDGLLSKIGALKALTFSISIAVLSYAFYKHPVPSFYPAYLTMWGVVFCILYLGGSFCLTVFCSPNSSSSADAGAGDSSNRQEPQASRLTKFTWFLYSVAAVLGCCIALLYWGFVYVPSRGVELNNVMTHGGLLGIVFLQGVLVDRVPVRIKHNLVGTEVIAIAYSIWLAIQNTVVKYNPMQDDDDDALYDSVKWREKPAGAAILVAIVLFVAIPLFTMLLWMLSLSVRRYVDDKSNDAPPEQAHAEDIEGMP